MLHLSCVHIYAPTRTLENTSKKHPTRTLENTSKKHPTRTLENTSKKHPTRTLENTSEKCPFGYHILSISHMYVCMYVCDIVIYVCMYVILPDIVHLSYVCMYVCMWYCHICMYVCDIARYCPSLIHIRLHAYVHTHPVKRLFGYHICFISLTYIHTCIHAYIPNKAPLWLPDMLKQQPYVFTHIHIYMHTCIHTQ